MEIVFIYAQTLHNSQAEFQLLSMSSEGLEGGGWEYYYSCLFLKEEC